jgi:hypothetical protein
LDDDEKKNCKYRLSYDDNYICRCPLRQYIAENFYK